MKMWNIPVKTIGLAAMLAAGMGTAQAELRIVGSSTVYPFSSYVAEELGATTDYETPVVESTGSGGGLKLFCTGNSPNTPDITNASRRMKVSEYETCHENGVTQITEAVIGSDGIVFAQNADNPPINLTLQELLLAVAAKVPQDGELVENPYTNWSQINPDLPDREIFIYGPPTTSGTRDAFEELVMEAASEEMEGYEEAYSTVRQDGVYIAGGENDNLLVERLAQNKDAFAIFGFSFLEENRDVLQGASVDGVKPTRDAISSGKYSVARSLYFYTKNPHFDEVAAMGPYVELFMSDQMIGERGLLKDIGLIPLPEDRRQEIRERVSEREPLEKSDLQ